MSTHYLIDTTTAPVTASDINDVRLTKDGVSLLGGNFVVRLPDGVSIGQDNPTDLTDLITKKYAGTLAFYAGFTRISYDDLLDATGINVPSCQQVYLGERSTIGLDGSGVATLESNPVVLTGSAPSQAVITYETFAIQSADPISGRVSRSYAEIAPASVSTCSVSFNGGGSFLTTTDGALLNIPPLDQGTSFIIRITVNATGYTVNLGSWAVIY